MIVDGLGGLSGASYGYVGVGCAGCDGGSGMGCEECGGHQRYGDGMGMIVGLGGLGDDTSSQLPGLADWFNFTNNGASGGGNGATIPNPFAGLNPFPTTDISPTISASSAANSSTSLDFFHTLGLDTAVPSNAPQAVGNNNGGGSNLWQTIAAGTAATFNSIAKSRYGVPPPNTYIQTNRDGSQTIVRLPQDASGNVTGNFTGLSLGSGAGGSSSLLLIGGLAVGALLLMKMAK